MTPSAPGIVIPPEGVPLHLNIAGVGVRLTAQIADILLTVVAALCFVIVLFWFGQTSPSTLAAITALLFFIIRVPYYILTELAWNGQTLGKRLMKIKVVSHDGGSLTAHALVLRNLMKEAEVFLPGTLLLTLSETTPIASGIALAWIIATLLVPLLNNHRRRLGDLMAGTHVIHLPQPVLLKDLAAAPPPVRHDHSEYVFLSHQLDHYGAYELQTLEDILRSAEQSSAQAAFNRQRATLASIIERIRKKIGYADPVPPSEQLKFLRAFYSAQREHLEQRQLFGDRRRDKHHSTEDK